MKKENDDPWNRRALRFYSRKELNERLEYLGKGVDFSYKDHDSELRRRDSNWVAWAVVCNALLVFADIVIRLFR